MKKPAYRWKENSRVKISAQVVGEELERLRIRHNGRLTPEIVVGAALAKTSPLHKAFEWQNEKAAARFRIEQAKYLIRSVEVVVEVRRGKEKPLRAFVSVEREKDRSYTSLAHAMTDAELRQQVLSHAWKELQSWRERYSDLSELSKIHAAIDKHLPSRVA